MVAHAAPLCMDSLSGANAIKVLDLLTNRYHVGIVRGSSEAALHVELPATAHFQAGQRIRFIVAGDSAVVARREMHRGFITQVSSPLTDRLHVDVAYLPETTLV